METSTAWRTFILPILIAFAALVGVYWWGGAAAFSLATLLVLLEITLSFDNAVVNAKILAHMSPRWQKRFLTWGIAIAVLGTRFLLPIFIVSASVGASPLVIAKLAAFHPGQYGVLIQGAKHAISAFGGTFLLMVSLKYFFDGKKEVHWIRVIERFVAGWGRIEAIEIGITLVVLSVIASLHGPEASTILISGIVGIVVFIVIEGIANAFTKDAESAIGTGSLALFIYLNILDAAFSLDGVVGAFALTSQLFIIVIGLGIGAYFVRAITLYLVHRRTLDALVYMEQGAHWAILALSIALLVSLFEDVPDLVTGSVSFIFVAAAYLSSMHLARRTKAV